MEGPSRGAHLRKKEKSSVQFQMLKTIDENVPLKKNSVEKVRLVKEKKNGINICSELKYGGARPSFCKFQAKTAEILEKHVRFYHTINFRKIIENYKGVTALEDCVCGKAHSCPASL